MEPPHDGYCRSSQGMVIAGDGYVQCQERYRPRLPRPDFYQDSSNFRGGRQISGTLTYSFGNMRAKKPRKMDNSGMQPEYSTGGDGLEYVM